MLPTGRIGAVLSSQKQHSGLQTGTSQWMNFARAILPLLQLCYLDVGIAIPAKNAGFFVLWSL